jgi:hypothetical protein
MSVGQANPRIKRLNTLLQSIAADKAIPFLDLNATLAPDGALLPDITPDGLHVAGGGYVGRGFYGPSL